MKAVSIFLFSFFLLFANHLLKEESPYLQQHAKNPVDWYPWSKEAFLKAKKENKLIFLSIGYSTCHWCHVMEKESFEDLEVAKILNKNFVAIKVDREEFPQIDRYYQFVYQILNRRGGGWPLTIILTPEKEPLFAATYIPKKSKMGESGLIEILTQISNEWKSNPSRLKEFAHKVKLYADEIRYRSISSFEHQKLDENISKIYVKALKRDFDSQFGGWGKRIKFPQAQRILTLLDIYILTKNKEALNMATSTLKSMALSGIYDQVEGGFFRYSTDRKWEIPHFEKMLYTNAELIEAYSKAWMITKDPLFKVVVKDTILLLQKKYQDPSGLFYGASDADSLNPKKQKKEEGFYFTYSYDEVKKFLEKESIDKKVIENGLNHYGITPKGNFINFRSNPKIANTTGSFPIVKKALQEIRANRVYPFIDKKMQSSWNALLIHALFCAGKIDFSYQKIAKNTLDALLKNLYKNGQLYHQILPKKEPKIPATLEDYAFVIEALLDAYDAFFEEKYLKLAKTLQEKSKEEFFDKKEKLWIDSKTKLSNPLNIDDEAYKSPLATLIFNHLRIGIILEDPKYNKEAKEYISRFFESIKDYPTSSSSAIRTSLAYLYGFILIKSEEKKMKKFKKRVFEKPIYPYFEFKLSNDEYIQACKIDRCFLHEKDLGDFFQKLLKILKI